jgi:zinc transport system permease protein
MMDVIDFLSHGFIQRALIAGSFIAILCSVLGVFLVLRRLSLIGDGLAHVTFGSVAIGLFLRIYPVYVAIPVVTLSSLGILKLIEKARLNGDAAIGIVSALGIAVGIMFASLANGFNIDLFSYLFGNILSINNAEVIISICLSIILLVTILLFYHDLFSVTFDEESARVSGIKTRRINAILVLLTSLTVCLAMKMVGIMLISALLIIPSVTALQMGKGFRVTLMLSSITGVFSVIAGIFISFMADLPTGATIVILNFLFFAVAFVYRKLWP